MAGCLLKNAIHPGSGGLAQSTGAGCLPWEEADETVMHDKNHLGLGNMVGEGFWCLEAFHFWFLVLHQLLQETMFSKTKLSLAQWHQVIPCKQSPWAEGRPKICRCTSDTTWHVRLHNFRGPLPRSPGESLAVRFRSSLQAWLLAFLSPAVSVLSSRSQRQRTHCWCRSDPQNVCPSFSRKFCFRL